MSVQPLTNISLSNYAVKERDYAVADGKSLAYYQDVKDEAEIFPFDLPNA